MTFGGGSSFEFQTVFLTNFSYGNVGDNTTKFYESQKNGEGQSLETILGVTLLSLTEIHR